eukprot:scaffold25197_cov53-Attheya_sp.AAC.3
MHFIARSHFIASFTVAKLHVHGSLPNLPWYCDTDEKIQVGHILERGEECSSYCTHGQYGKYEGARYYRLAW